MGEKPISMIPPLVLATLRGDKLETRRVMRPQPPQEALLHRYYGTNTRFSHLTNTFTWFTEAYGDLWPATESERLHCPYGIAGNHLWIREAWHIGAIFPKSRMIHVEYTADRSRRWVEFAPDRWDKLIVIQTKGSKSLRFMPREVARLILQIDEVEPQQLGDMTEEDAIREGVSRLAYPVSDDWYKGEGSNPVTYLAGFRKLWNEINAARGYAWRPDLWVWAIRYHVAEALAGAA